MPDDGSRRVDVLRYEVDEGDSYRAIDAGRGREVVAAHEDEVRKRRLLRWTAVGLLALAAVGYGLVASRPLLGALAGGGLLAATALLRRGDERRLVPEVVERDTPLSRAAATYDLDVRPDER